MRRVVIGLLILVVLAVPGAWAYRKYIARGEQPQQQREESPVKRGSLTALVNATGTILPEAETSLAFKGAGRIAEVLVKEGQTVHAGEVLATLETADLDYAVRQAELTLSAAQAQLLRLQRPPADYDIAAAQAAVDGAKASYDKLVAGPSPEELQVARTSLDQAKAARDQAQLAYNLVADLPNVAMLPQALQLQQATIAYDAAQANFELATRQPAQAELAGAQSAIAQAEAALARLQAGVSDEDFLAAQIQVQQAELSLGQARRQLEGTRLAAPHDGTITLVGASVGELSGGQPVFVVADLSQFHVDISVDEIDIGRVSVGQNVTVTLDALPAEALSGQVARIADSALFDAGVVTYKVRIGLNPTEAALREGMTANVDIVAERHDDVLLLPNRFIRIDRTTGETYVDRLANGLVQPVEIQIGLRNEAYSEILAGMAEGDVAVLVQESSQEQLRQTFQMGP